MLFLLAHPSLRSHGEVCCCCLYNNEMVSGWFVVVNAYTSGTMAFGMQILLCIGTTSAVSKICFGNLGAVNWRNGNTVISI